MVDLLTALTGTPASEGRSDWFGPFGFNGSTQYPMPNQTIQGDKEKVGPGFTGYSEDGYAASSIVFTLELFRMQVFSEARSVYRRSNRGRPGELFTTPSISVLQRPSAGTTEQEFRSRALLDVDLAGNNFAVRRNGKLKRLRPDWVTIVLGSDGDNLDPVVDPEAEVVGYLYHPGGNKTAEPIMYLADEVAHWAPIPDPLANYRGMSWLTPVAREIVADKQATQHKQKFLENGATPNMIIKHQINDPETLQLWINKFRESHEGAANAYRTLHLGGGADATVVGKDFQQLDFKAVQGAGETRIAAASGVGAVMAQFSEGMQGSSLNAGNYSAARRRVADAVFRPLWRSFAGSYEPIITLPRNAELWYDERDIAFLREDERDAAQIQNMRAQTVRTLLDAGYLADSVNDAVENDDFKLLKHSGLFSVQLQPPGATAPADESDSPTEDEPDE